MLSFLIIQASFGLPESHRDTGTAAICSTETAASPAASATSGPGTARAVARRRHSSTRLAAATTAGTASIEVNGAPSTGHNRMLTASSANAPDMTAASARVVRSQGRRASVVEIAATRRSAAGLPPAATTPHAPTSAAPNAPTTRPGPAGPPRARVGGTPSGAAGGCRFPLPTRGCVAPGTLDDTSETPGGSGSDGLMVRAGEPGSGLGLRSCGRTPGAGPAG